MENCNDLGTLNKLAEEDILKIWTDLLPNHPLKWSIDDHPDIQSCFLVSKSFKNYTFFMLKEKKIREIMTFSLCLSTQIGEFITETNPSEIERKELENSKRTLSLFIDNHASIVTKIFAAQNLPSIALLTEEIEYSMLQPPTPLPLSFLEKCKVQNIPHGFINIIGSAKVYRGIESNLLTPASLLLHAHLTHTMMRKSLLSEKITDDALIFTSQIQDNYDKDETLIGISSHFCDLKKFDKARKAADQIQNDEKKGKALLDCEVAEAAAKNWNAPKPKRQESNECVIS